MNRTPGRRRTDSSPADTRLASPGHLPWRGAAPGFIPELIGRFSRIVSFAPLDARTLGDILEENVLRAYEREFAHEGLELVVEPAVREWVVARALKRETGARGLRAALVPQLERAAYDHFGEPQVSTVRLVLKGEQVRTVTG